MANKKISFEEFKSLKNEGKVDVFFPSLPEGVFNVHFPNNQTPELTLRDGITFKEGTPDQREGALCFATLDLTDGEGRTIRRQVMVNETLAELIEQGNFSVTAGLRVRKVTDDKGKLKTYSDFEPMALISDTKVAS